jgi:hypothetical protein
MKRALTLTAATAFVTLAFAGTASAASTDVFLDGFAPHYFFGKKAPNAYNIYGRLESSKSKCVVGRKVTAYRVETGPDTEMGTDTSDSNGGWSVMVDSADLTDGDYYAKAAKRVLHDGTTCSGGRSENVPAT